MAATGSRCADWQEGGRFLASAKNSPCPPQGPHRLRSYGQGRTFRCGTVLDRGRSQAAARLASDSLCTLERLDEQLSLPDGNGNSNVSSTAFAGAVRCSI